MTPTANIEKPTPSRAEKPTPRHRQLVGILLKYGGRELVDRLRLGSFLAGNQEHMEEHAGELASDLEELGPTYIKFGQLLSTRSDLLPDAVLEQLERLQDQIQPMPFEMVKTIIEVELGRPLMDIFSSVEETPLGSASLGQVHAAVLRDGRAVAVKVQRPGIRELIASDIEALRDFAGWFEKRTEVGRRYAVAALVEEFNSSIMRELDYELEAQNMLRLKRNMAEFPHILVPSPTPELCTQRVLTMDFVAGLKVSRVGPLIQANMNGEKIADALLEAYLKQVFVDGFFHADPHPGNVFLVDSEHVALLDVGLVGYFAPTLRRKMLQMLPAIYEMDVNEMIELTLEVGEAEEGFNRVELKRRFGEIVQKSQSGSIEQIQVSRVLLSIVRASSECGVRLPAEMSTLGRTMFHLDKVGRFMAPGFDVNAAVRRHVGDIMSRQVMRDVQPKSILKAALEAAELLGQLPRRANRLMDALFERKLGMRIDVVPDAHLLENLQKIANRITLGLVLAALIVGASQLMQVQTTFQIFGYPGFAMICFIGALVGGLWLVVNIIRADGKTRDEVPPRS